MEFILGVILSWPVLVICLGLLMYSEHVQADGAAIFFLLVAGLLGYFIFNLTWTQVGIGLAAWLPLGVIYSFWRWKRHCSQTVKMLRDGSIQSTTAEMRVTLSQNVDKITHWIFAWPFSLLENIIGDLIDAIQSMVTGILRRTYERVSAKALAEIREQKTAEVLVDR